MEFGIRISSRIKSLAHRAAIRLARACLPRVDRISDEQFSLISPVADLEQQSKQRSCVMQLLGLALDAAHGAMQIDLSDVSARIRRGPKWPDIWPGEHYKFLAALVARIQPSVVVEIGTFLGVSSLAMKKYLPPAGRIVTFDILPWNAFQDTCFDNKDFEDGKLTQLLANLADPAMFEAHRELLSAANIIFMDGPKNRTFERAFLRQLWSLDLQAPALLVIDDIRLWSMLDIWNEIQQPKLDVTSLGHFSGTGLVLMSPK
jgi:predicted O-methyltransferase YrrM